DGEAAGRARRPGPSAAVSAAAFAGENTAAAAARLRPTSLRRLGEVAGAARAVGQEVVCEGAGSDREAVGAFRWRREMNLLAQALTAALIHFVWQAAAVGFLAWIALSILRESSAAARYLAACSALALLLALPLATV